MQTQHGHTRVGETQTDRNAAFQGHTMHLVVAWVPLPAFYQPSLKWEDMRAVRSVACDGSRPANAREAWIQEGLLSYHLLSRSCTHHWIPCTVNSVIQQHSNAVNAQTQSPRGEECG